MEDNFKIGDYTFKKGSILCVSHLATSLDESIWVKKKKMCKKKYFFKKKKKKGKKYF